MYFRTYICMYTCLLYLAIYVLLSMHNSHVRTFLLTYIGLQMTIRTYVCAYIGMHQFPCSDGHSVCIYVHACVPVCLCTYMGKSFLCTSCDATYVCLCVRTYVHTYMHAFTMVSSFSLRLLIVYVRTYVHTNVHTYVRCVMFVLLMLVVEGISLTLCGV